MNDTWKKLIAHRAETKNQRIEDVLKTPNRIENFSISLANFVMDFSKTSIDDTARDLLIELAHHENVEAKRDAMFKGDKINVTENRAVLHTALRNFGNDPIIVDEADIMPEVRETLARMGAFCEKIRTGKLSASNGKKFTDVVNIGIGGSELGPAMATLALAPYHDGPKTHFIANIDGSNVSDVLKPLNPETTLVVVVSKSFTTIETMTNADTAIQWLKKSVGANYKDHLASVSSNIEKTSEYEISNDRVFSFEDWVGGRYSVWGPVGLVLMLAIGHKNFLDFLEGAYEMDRHFCTAPIEKNMPIMLGLTGIWHNNICGYNTRAVLPYDQRLSRFPEHLQQLDMESNGKRVDRQGNPINCKSGPIVWGEPGTNGQHAFYQLLHQGTSIVPCEFLVAANNHEPELQHHHNLLVANCFAQSEALMKGRYNPTSNEPYRNFEGNRPSITIIYNQLNPKNLGSLIALYEHRIFVEGVIWDINSFDQWGVELGKELAKSMLPLVQNASNDHKKDASSEHLIKLFHNFKENT